MFGLRRKNLVLLIATFLLVLVVKFIWLDRQAKAVLNSPQLEVEHEVELVAAAPQREEELVPQNEVEVEVPPTLSPSDVDRINGEDAQNSAYMTAPFPEGTLIRTKVLNAVSVAEYYSIPEGGEVVRIMEADRLVSQQWTSANSNYLERNYSQNGELVSMSIRQGSYAVTYWYLEGGQIIRKVERNNNRQSCIQYIDQIPVSREDACSN